MCSPLTSDKLAERAIVVGQSRCAEIAFDAGKVLGDSAIPFALRAFGSLLSSSKHLPSPPLLAPKAAPVPSGRKSPVVAAGVAGTILCLLTTGFAVGGFECPCFLKLQLQVSGCVWVRQNPIVTEPLIISYALLKYVFIHSCLQEVRNEAIPF